MRKTNKIISFMFMLLGLIAMSTISKAYGLSGNTVSAAPGDTVNVTFTTSGVSSSNMIYGLESAITISGSATITGGSMSGGMVNSGIVSATYTEGTSSNVSFTIAVKVSDSASTGKITVSSSGSVINDSFTSSSISGSATINVTASSSSGGSNSGSDSSGSDSSGSDSSGSGSTGSDSSGSTTTLSSNAKLSSLSVGYTLSPAFSPSTYEYKTTVASTVNKLDISFKGQESGITYTIEGNTAFKEGTNKVVITVTPPDKDTSKNVVYTIWVTKEAEIPEVEGNIPDEEDEEEEEEEEEEEIEEEVIEIIELGLKSLMISGVQLSPTFSKDVYEYTAIYYGDDEILEILATASLEDSTIEIIGNEDLVYGENTIVIKVTGVDGEELEYTILLTKEEFEEVEEVAAEVDDKTFWEKHKYDVGIASLSVTLVGLCSALGVDIYKTKKANMDATNDFDSDEDDDELKSSMKDLLKTNEEIDDKE